MIVWTRWGILGLLIPVAFLVVAIAATGNSQAKESLAVKRAKAILEEKESATDDEEAAKTRALNRQKEAEELKANQRAKDLFSGIGCVLAGGALWPLGRWMNKTESRTLVDPQSGQQVELHVGGGHTLFFIPLEYWSFIWVVIGLFRFLG